MSIGATACRNTRSLWLPRRASRNPWRPSVAMTIGIGGGFRGRVHDPVNHVTGLREFFPFPTGHFGALDHGHRVRLADVQQREGAARTVQTIRQPGSCLEGLVAPGAWPPPG